MVDTKCLAKNYGTYSKFELHLAGKNMPDWLINGNYKGIINHQKVDDAVGFIMTWTSCLYPYFQRVVLGKNNEGMALAKPIISTSIGAEGIEHNENLKLPITKMNF